MAVVDRNDFNSMLLPEPNGNRVVYSRVRENRSNLWLSETNDIGRQLTSGDMVTNPWDRYRIESRYFDWHPEGSAVAYVSEMSGSPSIWTVDVETGEKSQVTRYEKPDGDPRYSPSGSELCFVTNYWSPGSLGIVSKNEQMLECLRDDKYVYADPQWKDEETLYATRTEHYDVFDDESEIVRVSRDGQCEVIYSESKVLAFGARPRPGSEEIALIHEGSGYKSLYIMEPGSTPERLFVEDGIEIGAPAWNESGDSLAVSVSEEGLTQVYTVSRDGEIKQITSGQGQRFPPSWRNNDVIAMVTTPTRPPEVRNLSADETIARTDLVGFDERLISPENVTYESSDGLKIQAHVYFPKDFHNAEDSSVPLLVHPHGGPTAMDQPSFNFRPQYFAALGYVVIQPNYRGSEGFGREFRNANDYAWGEEDLDDVVESANFLASEYTQIDDNRAGIFGGSAGGQMTVNALGRSDRFSVGAAFYGVYDYETFVDDTDDIGFRLLKRELGVPASEIEKYRDASPIEAVPSIDVPLLLLHGEEDKRVPITQSEQLTHELEKHGKRYEFQRYSGEPHGFTRRETIVDAYTRVADFFAKYLKLDPDDGSSYPHSPSDAAASSSDR